MTRILIHTIIIINTTCRVIEWIELLELIVDDLSLLETYISYSYIQVAQIYNCSIVTYSCLFIYTHTLRSLIPIIRFEVVCINICWVSLSFFKYSTFQIIEKEKKDDDVGNMRRLLKANNYSIYVPSISLITCLFMNNSQEK